MTVRDRLVDLLTCDAATFRSQAGQVLDDFDDGTDARRRAALDAGVDAFDGPDALDEFDSLARRTRELVWRLWLLDEAPLGLTLTGPAYQDNPLVYANRTFRRLTGYDLATLQGENLRLLQGSETDVAAVDDLREALDIWEPVTVELRNYRRDGTAFTNRLSLVPLADDTGTVAHWLGVQAAVDGR
jgi:PAS domain S-box-containing protein